MTHLSVWLVHVLLVLDEGTLGAGGMATGLVSAAWVEGVGAMGVAGMLKFVEVEVDLVENLDGTFGCLFKVFKSLPVLLKLGVCLLIL